MTDFTFSFLARARATVIVLTAFCAAGIAGCGGNATRNIAAEAPPPAQVVREQDANLIQVNHPEQFSLVTVGQHDATSKLAVTGVVTPDISRTVPVISLASGRVVEIHARLGDVVTRGQVLLRVQSSDISGAYADYRKAKADEVLARAQLDRAKDLQTHGAMSVNDLQTAQDTEDKAKVDVETTAEHLKLLGSDLDHPTGIVDIVAPVSGVITDQEVTNAAGVQGLSAANPFTISDLSNVWIVCDVYENDLPTVRMGDAAEITLNAYPGKVIAGRISNIGAIMDPNIRTAKVRIEVRNPGLMRIGMFVTATFRGQTKETHATVPATAIVHLHDRDWVYVPAGDKKFKCVEVVGGDTLPDNIQEIISGIKPGAQVVQNALVFQNATEQ